MLKLGLFLLDGIVSILILLVSECFVVSLSSDVLPGAIYRLVTVVRLNVGPISLPIYKCDFHGLWVVVRNHTGEVYLALGLKYLLPFFIAAVFWYVCYILIARVSTLTYNRKTTLHGSSKWMTTKELENLGMLNKAGLVMGQTSNAKFRRRRSGRPRRRKDESRGDFESRLAKWSPKDVDLEMETPGDLIVENGNNHTLVVGSTRSGKGVSVIIPTEFQWNESMIVLDPKSEGWGISANFRSRFSYTFKFEPEHPKQSIHYNPLFSIRRGRQTIPDIQNLALILIPYNENAKDPFWDNEARKLLAAVIGYVVYCEPPERKTFRQVYSVFTASIEDIVPVEMPQGTVQDDRMGALKPEEQKQDDGESAVKKYLRRYAKNAALYNESMPLMGEELRARFEDRYRLPRKERESVELEAMQYLTEDDKKNLERFQQDLAYFANCEDRQLSSVVSTMMSNLQVIADPNVQDVTDRSDFVMEDFVQGVVDENGVRHPISLYLCVSLSSMKRLMPLIRMMYEQAVTLLTRELRKNPYKLLLVFDEFYQMGRMEIVEKALSLTAGYGVLCAVVIQSFDQLQKLYQSEATFTDNFARQIILRVNELKTCEKISKTLGNETKRQKKLGTSGNVFAVANNSTNLNIEQVGRELMTAEEIRTMPEDDCIIFMSGEHPYKAKKVRYYLDERFRRLYLDDRGRVLPAPESEEALEENQPHPDAVERTKEGKVVRRVGVDDEGWHLLVGYNGALPEFELKEPGVRARGEDDFIDDEPVDPFVIDADSMNEVDAYLSDRDVLDLMGLSEYPDESQDPAVLEVLQYYQAEREKAFAMEEMEL